MDDNHRLLSMISTLKIEFKEVQCEFDSLTKFIKILTFGFLSLNNILCDGKFRSDKKGLGFSEQSSYTRKPTTVFIFMTLIVKDTIEEKAIFPNVNDIHQKAKPKDFKEMEVIFVADLSIYILFVFDSMVTFITPT